VFGAPGDVLTQVERVRLTGEAAIAGEESAQRELFSGLNKTGRTASAVVVAVEASMAVPPASAGTDSQKRSALPAPIGDKHRTAPSFRKNAPERSVRVVEAA
jgi:hypothetical protein